MVKLGDSEFVLAVMPFVDVLQPPLGPSVLCGALRSHGLKMKAVYPAMTLAEHIPYDLYSWFGAGVILRFGDYFFSNQVFGADDFRTKAFQSKVRQLDADGRFPALGTVSNAEAFLNIVPFIQSCCDELTREWACRIAQVPNLKAVACSSTYVQLLASLALLKAVKSLRPDVKTMIGGCECEGESALEIVAKFDFVDYSLSGEGDLSLPILMKSCMTIPLEGTNLPFGVFDKAKAKNGRPESPKVLGGEFGEIDNADYMEAAAVSVLFRESKTAMSMEFSRGCWKGERNHCSFCGINGDRLSFRKKPAERILRELKDAYARGTRFFFTTDTVLDLNYLRPVFDQFSAYANDVSFLCDAVSTMTEDQLKYLADCGVLFIQVGIESLHPKHVALMNKSNSPAGSIAYLRFAKENHIHALWNILVCMPGDSPVEYQELAELIPLIEHFTPPGFSPIRYDRFSEYWKDSGRYGLELRPIESNGYLFPQCSNIDTNRVTMYFDNVAKDAYTPHDHPSILKLQGMINDWHSSVAVLRFLSDGRIEDTRRCACERYFMPTAEERIVLGLTRNPVPVDKICNEARATECKDVMSVVNGLQERNLIVRWDGHFVSLVLEPINPDRECKILKRLKSATKSREYMDTRFQEQLANAKKGQK